jgi:hypothetical protein
MVSSLQVGEDGGFAGEEAARKTPVSRFIEMIPSMRGDVITVSI